MSLEGLVRVQVERAERFDLEAQGTVRLATQLPATVRIVNLSRSGCLFRASAPVELGATISVGIPGIGACPAIVMRVAADGLGCAFVSPLTQAQITSALTVRDPADGRASDAIRRLRDAPAEPAPDRPASLWRRMKPNRAA